MEFVDTDLKEIVSYLRDRFQGANFMLQPKAENIRVTLSVRNVGMEQALQAVAFASEGRVAVNKMDYHFYGLVLVDPAVNPAQKPTCRVFNLSGAQDFSDARADTFLDELKRSIEQAVTTLHAVDAGSAIEMPELQFHRGAKLLVAVGKPDSLGVVEQFVLALGGRAADLPQPGRNAAPAAPATRAGFGGFGGAGSYAPGIGNGTGVFGTGGGVGANRAPGDNNLSAPNGFPGANKASNNAPQP
jgi:hypothetical protein